MKKVPSSAAASKEETARKSQLEIESKQSQKTGSHVPRPTPPKAKPQKNRLGPQGEVMPKL